MSNDHDLLIRVDSRTENIASDVASIKEYLKHQNGRLRKVEAKTAYIMGVGAVLIVLVNVLSRWLL